MLYENRYKESREKKKSETKLLLHDIQISENNGIQMTNEEIRLMTIRAAQNITKLGSQKDAIIGIVANNHQHLAPIVFVAISIGCPINVLHHTFGRIRLAGHLNR